MGDNQKKQDTFYTRLFAKLYDPVMQQAEARLLDELRRGLLRRAKGHILEVGAGTGANFAHYPPGAEVLAIEPSAAMAERARQQVPHSADAAKVEVLEAGLGDEALKQQIGPGSLDYIVCTLVLCTLPDLEEALRLFQQWLRPGGQLLVLEHIHDQRQPQRCLQSALNPLWKQAAEGCHLNRPTDLLLRQAGFRPIEEDYRLTAWVPFYIAVLESTAQV